MTRYAKTTSVPVERSKAEIERTLKRYGIEEFFYGTSPRGDGIGFRKDGKLFKIAVPMVDRNDFRTEQQWQQAKRRRYRVLLLSIKAKLEAIEDGQTSFDIEFLAHIALPDGSTVGENIVLQINKAIEAGKKPKLLLPGMEP